MTDSIILLMACTSVSILCFSCSIIDGFQTQLQSRQGRPEVVGYCRDHSCAILDKSAQPALHPVEGLDDGPNFVWPTEPAWPTLRR